MINPAREISPTVPQNSYVQIDPLILMEDVQNVMNKLNQANELMENLIDLAMEDEKLSDDEKEMLLTINRNLGKYAKAIIESISDGEVDLSEMETIHQLERQIVEEAQKMAEQDQVISREEQVMLTQLIDVIESI